jgi:hypothetical protein
MRYTPHSTEAELVQGCRSNDRLAQKYLYQRFFGQMMGICMRYTGQHDEAVDVLFAVPVLMDAAIEINAQHFLVRDLFIAWRGIRAKTLAIPPKFRIIALAEIVIEFDKFQFFHF